MQKETKHLSARIPQELYDRCNQQYASMTDAAIAGLELLCNTNCNTNVTTNELLIEEKDTKITELQSYIETLEKEIKDLRNQTPNNDILQLYEARLIDLQSHNETLKKELETFQSMHNNYMLQVQTIINQKSIQEPNHKKPWWQFW